MKVSSFKYLVNQGIKSIWVNRLMSFASLCIMTVSLLMVGLSVLVSVNITKMIGNIESKNEVIVVIADGAPQVSIDDLGNQLKSHNNVASVTFFSKDEAWVDMQKDMTEDEKELFQYIDSSPLPDTYRVRIKDISKLKTTCADFESYSFVDEVNAPTDFASILTSLRNIVAILSSAIIAALIIVCLVIISNTTRTSVFARRKEINIMKYVGATNGFIKVPFFVEGTVIGVVSAIIATITTKIAYDSIFGFFENDFQLWSMFGVSSLIPFNQLAWKVFLAYLLCGIVIGAIGTVISTRKHLNV